MWRAARSLIKLLEQVDAAAPGRATGNDGLIGDAAHRRRKSDHNPDQNGVVRAIDITHDPAHGVDAGKIAEALVKSRDPRIRYIIWNKRIIGNEDYAADNGRRAWVWSSTADHEHHIHISVEGNAALYDDESPWSLGELAPAAGAEAVPDRPVLREGSIGADVRRLQQLLGVRADGVFGPITRRAVVEFQHSRGLEPDGAVGGYAWDELEKSPESQQPSFPASTPRAVDIIRKLAPGARPEYLAAFERGDVLLAAHGITTPLRLAHFLAQVLHESGGLCIDWESGAYSAKRLLEVFGVGRHSARVTPAEARQLERKPAAIFERVYGLGNPRKARELGNTEPGDGYKYRGGGILQTTGRANYRRMGQKVGVDFEAHPEWVLTAEHALKPALAEWTEGGLNAAADRDDIRAITKKINGGYNGLDDRRRWLAKAKRALGI